MRHHAFVKFATSVAAALLITASPGVLQGQTAAKAKTEAKAAALLDLNTATAKDLEATLPGVGEVTARKIVAGRPYASVDDLAKAGVPEHTIKAIRPLVSVGTPKAVHRPRMEPNTSAAKPGAPVNLNTASLEELETLPGVGPAHAKAIVAGRPYTSVDGLTSVKGLSKARVDELRPLVVVHAAPERRAEMPSATAPRTAAKPGAPVNLNTASLEELETLPGVGPAHAKAIVAGRPYTSVDGLASVKGLGKARVDELRPLVVVHAAPERRAEMPTATTSRTATHPAAKPGAPVNLNTASLEELETLPGVGPAHAKAIVAGRPYTSVDGLGSVKGLGKARVDELRPLVVVQAAPERRAEMPNAPTTRTAARPAAKPAASAYSGKPVNINTASKEELDVLPGIGPVKAQAIVETRANQPFKTIEDIMKVKGIKEGEFSKIKNMITVD